MSSDRICMYFDDCKLLLENKNILKICNEIKKLTNWLQKHQNESVPDNIKVKLMSIVDSYYRFGLSNNNSNLELKETILNLFSTYLQLPEGKLVSSKDKKKVLNWISEYNTTIDDNSYNIKQNNKMISIWSIEEIIDNKLITILNKDNNEMWKENYQPINIEMYKKQIQEILDQSGFICYIELNETTNEILQIFSETL